MSHAVCANPTSASRKALAKHSSSAKHHKAKGAQAGTGNIFQAFAQQDAKQREQKSCEEKARDAELIYLHHIEAHGIPPHMASCTTLLFKQMFPDSKIAEKFTFSDTKQGYEITHGLGQHYNNLTLVPSYWNTISICIYTSHVVCTSAGINYIRITIVCICFNLVLYAVTGAYLYISLLSSGGCFGAWIDHLDSFKNPNPRHSKVGFLKVVCYKHWSVYLL